MSLAPRAWFEAPAGEDLECPGYMTVQGWLALPEAPAARPRLELDGRPLTGLLLGTRTDVERAHPGHGWVRGFSACAEVGAEPGSTREVTLQVASGDLVLATWRGRVRCQAPASATANLFLLGAAKCGTSALHAYLGRHPDVCMSAPKEPFFFEWDTEYRRGPGYYQARYFGHRSGEAWMGEARHRNLYLPYVPARIHEYNPEARLVVSLRHPIERALSDWWYSQSGAAAPLSFHNALGLEQSQRRRGVVPDAALVTRILDHLDDSFADLTHLSYLASGDYAPQLRRYLELFPRERLHVLLFEDLAQDPGAVMRDLLGFLDLDPAAFPRGALRPVNVSPPMPGVPRWLARGLPLLARLLGRPGLHAARHRWALEPDTLEFLRGYYRPKVEELEDLLGRGLPWSL